MLPSSFNDIRERLTIPYLAIIAFADPSVRFGLQFETEDGAQASNNAPEPDQVRAGPMLVEVGKEDEEESGEDTEGSDDAEASEKDGDEEKANVVTLDTFRKK